MDSQNPIYPIILYRKPIFLKKFCEGTCHYDVIKVKHLRLLVYLFELKSMFRGDPKLNIGIRITKLNIWKDGTHPSFFSFDAMATLDEE